jgi:hypothetical protein
VASLYSPVNVVYCKVGIPGEIRNLPYLCSCISNRFDH